MSGTVTALVVIPVCTFADIRKLVVNCTSSVYVYIDYGSVVHPTLFYVRSTYPSCAAIFNVLHYLIIFSFNPRPWQLIQVWSLLLALPPF